MFWNDDVISSDTLQGMCVFMHAEIKVRHFMKENKALVDSEMGSAVAHVTSHYNAGLIHTIKYIVQQLMPFSFMRILPLWAQTLFTAKSCNTRNSTTLEIDYALI